MAILISIPLQLEDAFSGYFSGIFASVLDVTGVAKVNFPDLP